MAQIPPLGNKLDFYSRNGVTDLAIIPGGTHPDQPADAPVRLQRGDFGWGAIHIATKHGHWLDKNNLQVHEMVWFKLQQAGGIYNTEEEDKLKISLRISPSALLILRFIPRHGFFTVVSLFLHPNGLDGEHIGHYPGNRMQGAAPNLILPIPVVPVPVKVIYKKKFSRPRDA